MYHASINANFLDFTWHDTILTLKDCGKLRMHKSTEEQWGKNHRDTDKDLRNKLKWSQKNNNQRIQKVKRRKRGNNKTKEAK